MTIANDVKDFLNSGGKSAKFDNIGDAIRGTVIAAETRQQTDYSTGVPKTYDDGNPMMQLVVTIQTDLNEEDGDDGRRNLYIKGSAKDPSSGRGALIGALRAAGVENLAEGGTIAMQFTGLGTATRGNPPKQWKIAYKAPDPVQTGDLLADGPAPAAATPAPQQATPAAPASDAFADL